MAVIEAKVTYHVNVKRQQEKVSKRGLINFF